MEGTAEEQRMRKVQAGRDKLARFRQHKTKRQSAKAQKKTQKRKGEVVHQNDIPPEEDPLSTFRYADEGPVLGAEQLSTEIRLDHSSLDVSACLNKMSVIEYRLEEKLEDSDIFHSIVSQFSTTIDERSSKLNKQGLQSAVYERDEIITQLSSNLQQALMDRKEMEEEALCLSSQIQAIQLQLQDASMVLKDKSLGKKGIQQAQQQFAVIHSNIMDQTVRRAQDLEKELETSHKTTKEKENQMAKQQRRLEILQQKLDLSQSSMSNLQQELFERNQEVAELKDRMSKANQAESQPSLSGDDKGGGDKQRLLVHAEDNHVESLTLLVKELKEKLAASEQLRESLVKKFEKQMEDFEKERISWEQRHKDDVSSLTEKLQQASQTVAQDKDEKDRLNQEICNLKASLRFETESNEVLKLQHDTEVQTLKIKIQSMEEDKTMVCQKLSRNKNESSDQEEESRPWNDSRDDDFRHDLEDIKKNLSRVKARKEHENSVHLHKEELDDQNPYEGQTSMDKYLIPSQSDLLELSCGSEDLGEHSRFELDSDFMLEQTISSTIERNLPLLCSPMPITGVLSGAASVGTILDPESFAIYLSNNLGSSDENSDQSPDFTENFSQKCRVLMIQLEKKEQELQMCSASLEESLSKWREVTAELAATQLELDKEKTFNSEKLQKLGEDLRKENAESELSSQGQHLKEIENQLRAKDEQLSQLTDKNKLLENRLSVAEKELERTLELNKKMQISNDDLIQNVQDFEKARESDRQEFDNKLNFKGLEQQLLQEAIKEKEQEFFRLEEILQEELHSLKQVNKDLQSRLQEQNAHNVDLEALRLSLNNMHAAQLELSQSNLLKEKENDLIQLRENLNGKRAQEMALLQNRQQFELQQLRDEHSKELKNLKEELFEEMLKQQEEHSREIQRLKDENANEVLVLERKYSEIERLQELHRKEKELWNQQEDLHFQDIKKLEDLLSQNLEAYSKDIDLLKEQHTKEALEMQTLHLKEREDLKEDFAHQEKEWEIQKDEHSKEIHLLREEHLQDTLQQKELHSKILQLELEFSEEIKQLKEHHDTEKDILEKLHGEEKQKWKNKKNFYCQELEQLSGERSQEAFQNQKHLAQIDLLIEEHAAEVMKLYEQHKEEMKRLNEDHVLEKEECEHQRDQLSEELKLLQEEFFQKTLQHNELQETIVLEKDEREHQRDQLSEELKLLQEEFSQKTLQHNELQETIQQLQQKYSTEILHLQDLHNTEKDQLLNTFCQEKQIWQEQQEQSSMEILQLKEQCKEMEAFQNLLVCEQEDWNKTREDQSEVIKQLQEEISLKVTQLQEHSRTIEHLEQQNENSMKEVVDQHHRERIEWEKERDQCSQELDLLVNQHSQELKRIGEELLQVSLKKEEQHSKMLNELQEEFSMTILDLQNQHGKEMQSVVELHAKEKEQWESGNQDISEKHEIQEELKLIPECSLQDLEKIKEPHDKEVKALNECHRLNKTEWGNELKHLSEQFKYLVDHNCEEIKKYLDENCVGFEWHSAKIQELQDHYRKESVALLDHYAQKILELKDHPQALGDELHQLQTLDLLDQNEHCGQYSQVSSVHVSHEVKIQSSQEMQFLWSQIDCSRASRQELNELKEQLIARSMHIEEIERMKQDFHKQQEHVKAAHEKDMEDLRIYFEQKSRVAEENYRENLELLHQRLREMTYEGREEISTLNSSLLALDESFENEKTDLLLHLTDQLVQHKEELSSIQQQSQDKHKHEMDHLHAALSQQFQEDLNNMKMDLSDKYTCEIETLKNRHSLELEQLRAELSTEHIKEITRIQLENSDTAGGREITLGKQDHLEEHTGWELSSSPGEEGLKKLEKFDKICQTGTTPEEQHVGCVPHSQLLQEQNTLELANMKDQMVTELKELVRTLSTEKSQVLKVLKESLHKTKQFWEEQTDVQGNLLREPQTSLISKEQHSKLISIHLTHKEDVNLEQEHRWEPGTCVSDSSENVSTRHPCFDGDLHFQSSDLECNQGQDLLSCISELLHRHKVEVKSRDLELEANIQELEASHLVKLDTLESSYLSEIQKIRDEHALAVEELEVCFSDRLCKNEQEIQERLEQARALWLQQQEQAQQQLRQELASMHIQKFEAMAKELEVAHQDDLKEKLDEQCLQLEYDKSQALDILREEVLRMEDHNKLVLQELSDLHRTEVQQQTHTLQDELMKLTSERQKQELVITELNNQLQDLSTELQNKSNQLSQLQEEIELLKCQSEILLEQQIAQLKEEFVIEKTSAIKEIEEQVARDSENVQSGLNKEKELLVGQLEEKNVLVLQLQEKVSTLTNEMEELQSQMEAIVDTRDRENEEGKNLETILQSEVQLARQEQEKLQDSCQHLLKIFTDVLKNTLLTEDLIFKKIGLCLDTTLSQMDEDKTKSTVSEKHRLSPDCDTMTELSLMSTDEGYEVSEYLCDSVLGSLEVGLENEDKIVQMSQRLRSAVERLLDMVSNSAVQLEQTREVQKSFEEEFKSRNREMAQVVLKNQDLMKLLAQETEIKNQLQVELHKAQGLIDGYAAEKVTMEETLFTKETSERQLVVELEKSKERLNKVLTQEPSALGEEKELLMRLQEVLSSSEKDVKVELLKETQRLIKEKLELLCQADKDRSNLLHHMRVLEMELEDQMATNQELVKKSSEMTDLEQQIQVLEKQLKHQRHFMDEQAIEREHERDDFQQEIRNLEEQLKVALKNHGDSRTHRLHDWSEQNETSGTSAKEKVDLNLLIEGKGHLEQQIVERNEEIDKMLSRIQEVEQAALSNADAAKKCSQVEAELQNLQRIQSELLQDKEALQQQQYNNVLQISALQSKLDENRHRLPVEGEPDSFLKKELQAEREALQRKEKEIESLAEQLELFREELTNKAEEVLQLNMQLEIQRKQSEQAIQQSQQEYLRLREEMSSLHLEKSHDHSSSSLELLQSLLQEKNQEIDHLNDQFHRLQEETSDVEELKSLVEHLRSDQDRLRKSKEEELEQLHEVIEKLQQELEQLGPIRHEVSDSQESLDQLGLGGTDNLQSELRKGAKRLERAHAEKERLEEMESLNVAELEALTQQLEEKETLHIAEIEVLETNLHNIQQSFKQNEQALEFLQLEHSDLHEESKLLRSHVSQREEAISVLSTQLQKLQDTAREKDALLVEKELEVQTLQEQNMGDMSELRNQLAQSVQSLEATKIDLQKVQEQNVSLQTTLSESSKKQSEREIKYTEELEELKGCLKEWKERSQTIVEEVQTQTEDASQNNSELEAESRWKKEACVKELQSYSQNLCTQVKKLHEALMSQEAMISVISVDLQKQNFEDEVNEKFVNPRSFSESLTNLSTLDSPDLVRKQEQAHSLRGLTPFSELSIDHSAELDVMKSKSSGCVKQLEKYNLLRSSTPSLSDSNYSMQRSSPTQRSSPVRETGHPMTDYDSYGDQQSSREDRIETDQSDELDHKLKDGTFQLDEAGNLYDQMQKMESISGSGLSTQLQKMLSMVHKESLQILELSERPAAKFPSTEQSDLQIQKEAWLKEQENLQETIQSLSSALAQAAGKGEQDAAIVEDLKSSLLREQERSTEQYKLLLQEQSAVSQLRYEVEELQLELEKLKRKEKQLQMEASKLRNELESKEEATSVFLQTVQTQREVERQKFEEEKKIIQQRLVHHEKSLQDSCLSLEEHKKLNAKISSAMLQEQTFTSNLRKELEIEQSRCKALLAQEHKKLSEIEADLEKERQFSSSLSSALNLERSVVEQLRQQQSQELCRQEEERQQERRTVVTLQNQLEEQRQRAKDLAAMIEMTQKQALGTRLQLESDVQTCREELQKEREAAVKLHALLEALQGQKLQLDTVMEQQREREIQLQKERDQYHTQLMILHEEEKVWAKERERETARPKQTEVNRAREEEQDRRMMDLQLQHERDVRRIQELQHMLADLEEQERALASRRKSTLTDMISPAKNVCLTSQMQKVWQQLLHTVLQVKKWVHNKSESAHHGFPNEAEVTALLESLAQLKLELQKGNIQQSVSSPSTVVDVLKRENEELATNVSQLTKEKLELRSQLAKLSRSLQEPSFIENKLCSDSIESVLEAERAVWNREKRLLQIALKHAESELGKATLENRPVSDVPNSKMQRLYRKYLRAESFRKALVYQKKYLLLLLGGFQACEKATLSLIARMGVYPSPADLQYPAKCPSGLTKFRSAVRAVIAISRLKFLVRKWNKTSRKSSSGEPVAQQVHTSRTEVLQHLSGTLLNSPPTRDVVYGHNHSSSLIATPSPKPLPWSSRRVGHSPALTPERSPYLSRDPEHSITEYIQHLEMVQRRLGGLQNGHSPELTRVKYAQK